MTKHTHYTEDFKRQAVALLETRDTTATQLARELGVRQNQLYKWREEIKQKGGEAFKGPGRPLNDQMSEVSRLSAENKRLKEDLEILKKAATFFAKQLP